jgi:serine/threonine protein kinase
LHKETVVHRDIRPENVLIYSSPEGYPVAKIADFGTARSLKDGNYKEWVGDPFFCAPELTGDDNHGFSIDVFSLGTLSTLGAILPLFLIFVFFRIDVYVHLDA